MTRDLGFVVVEVNENGEPDVLPGLIPTREEALAEAAIDTDAANRTAKISRRGGTYRHVIARVVLDGDL